MKRAWQIALSLILLLFIDSAFAEINCDATGVCYVSCDPVEIMVRESRMHLKCQNTGTPNLKYFAYPVENVVRSGPGRPLIFSAAAHKFLLEKFLTLGMTAAQERRRLWIGFDHAPINNKGMTEDWGCLINDCALLRSMAITDVFF